MNAQDLIALLQRQGFTLIPLPDDKLAVKPAARLTEELRQHIRQCKGEVLALLPRPPHLNARGEMIISFTADSRYHWWAGGQSTRETLRELNAPPDVLARYLESDSGFKRRQ